MKKVISIILTIVLLAVFMTVPVSAAQNNNESSGTSTDLSDYEIYLNGETWQDYMVNSTDKTLSLAALNISVRYYNGTVVPQDAYDLIIEKSYWDFDKEEEAFEKVSAPFGISDDDKDLGMSSYRVYAEAVEGSGYTGTTPMSYFDIEDVHSFYGAGVSVDFHGYFECYYEECWHETYDVPVNFLSIPDYFSFDAVKLTENEDYTVSYYKRYTDPDNPDDNDYETLYPETDPLEGFPQVEGQYFAKLEGIGDYYQSFYYDFNITESKKLDISNYDVKLDGESWRTYTVDSADETITLEELNITVCDPEGRIIDESDYTLTILHSLYYDEELEKDITEPIEAPYGICEGEDTVQGFSSYVVEVTTENSEKYTGQMTRFFEIFDTHSFNYFGCDATFGEEYQTPAYFSWHNYAVIPYGKNPELIVRNAAGDTVPKENYTVTYYVMHREKMNYDEHGMPDYKPEEVYARTDPVEGFPKEYGSYFAVIEGVEPYYGTGFIDFEITDYDPDAPQWYAERLEGSIYYPGATVYLKGTDERKITFALEDDTDSDLIPGWLPDKEFTDNGFTVGYEDINGKSYAVISSDGLSEGTKGKLIVSWYHRDDVFDEEGVHWDTAVPVTSGYINIEIAPDKIIPYMLVLGDTDTKYFEGDTIKLAPDDKKSVVAHVNYSDEQLIPIAVADDLTENGFIVNTDDPSIAVIDTTDMKDGQNGVLVFEFYTLREITLYGLDKAEPVVTISTNVEVSSPQPDIKLGDADGDGEISINDATLVQKVLSGMVSDPYAEKAGDIDGDGELSVNDVTYIQKYIAGYDIPFDIE